MAMLDSYATMRPGHQETIIAAADGVAARLDTATLPHCHIATPAPRKGVLVDYRLVLLIIAYVFAVLTGLVLAPLLALPRARASARCWRISWCRWASGAAGTNRLRSRVRTDSASSGIGGGGGIRTHGAYRTRDFQSRPLGLYGTPPDRRGFGR